MDELNRSEYLDDTADTTRLLELVNANDRRKKKLFDKKTRLTEY
jgi:hypothetical protein